VIQVGEKPKGLSLPSTVYISLLPFCVDKGKGLGRAFKNTKSGLVLETLTCLLIRREENEEKQMEERKRGRREPKEERSDGNKEEEARKEKQ
jgi:hypothetical protein